MGCSLMDRQRLNERAVTWLSASLLLTQETVTTIDLTWPHRIEEQVQCAEELWTTEVQGDKTHKKTRVLRAELETEQAL